MMDTDFLQQKTTDREREISKLQILQRQEGSGRCVWNICGKIRGTTGHQAPKAKGCQRHCFYMCGVAQHAEETPGR